MDQTGVHAKIYSVSELSAQIKQVLEQKFPFVWVLGEISNFRVPTSGHYYFTLKDEGAQIQAVMFRGQNRNLKFRPEDGLSVTGLGRITVYEPRGTYQIVLEYLEPKGVGALQVAFEQLKQRLASEGLFDPAHKRRLPFLPKRICLITSPTGAVVQDMINILDRRFPSLAIDVIPVKVQGPDAALEIVNAINWMNVMDRADVAILARGGGSLEDLQAFNDETVARAIFESRVPIVSAVGHETDFTIADFVADLRAPTPSAAAEMSVPIKSQMYEKIYEYKRLMIYLLRSKVKNCSADIRDLSARLVDPRKKVSDYRLRLDDLCGRLIRSQRARFDRCREHLTWSNEKLFNNNPIGYIKKIKPILYHSTRLLQQRALNHFSQRQSRLREYTSALTALNPSAILARGYSITRTLPDGAIVRDAACVRVGQQVGVRLSAGSLTCDVKEKRSDG